MPPGTPLPNGVQNSTYRTVRATSIGGTATGAGNVISGNANGVVFGSGTGTTILGNRIGTDFDRRFPRRQHD